jgi:hypothetical protein
VSSPYLVVIDAPSFQLITSGLGLFDHEVAFSDRAPRLADFWDDSVSADALQPAVRKVVRIRAEAFVEIVPHLLGEPRNLCRPNARSLA